ncbi:MAG TPA: PfkB family carbohydrate kinase, partial [Polyangiaceae bacterium]|nr:PfkB family carbohydrate kinase [Polyangiaceae bacterium]
YDLNFRESLWRSAGGREHAREVNRSLLPLVDVLFGNEEDFSAALGFGVESTGNRLDHLSADDFRRTIADVMAHYPNLRAVATTLRTARSASVNGWGAIACVDGQFYEVAQTDIEIFDRVGGGDSFAAGFLYGLLSGKEPEWSLRCGVAHGALAMSTPGDTTMATLAEVLRAMSGEGARIQR